MALPLAGLLLGMGALSGGTNIVSAMIQSSAARRATAAQLGALDRAQMFQENALANITRTFAPFISAGVSGLQALRSRALSSTERRLDVQRTRLGLQQKVKQLSEGTDFHSVPILTGEKASERRASLFSSMESTRLADLREAQARLDTFETEQIQLAPLFAEQDAALDARELRINTSLDRIAKLSDIPTSLADIRSELTTDPIFQFRREEGERAINRAAAARGSFFSGAAIKSLADFSMALTGEETDKSINRRLLALQGAISGFGAEAGEAQREFGNISTLAQFGQQAATTLAGGTATIAGGQANIAAREGEASAAGIMAQADAITGALGGVTRDVGFATSLLALPGLLNKPSAGDAKGSLPNETSRPIKESITRF